MTADAQADALLEALFSHAPVGLGFWDGDLRYRRINPALAAINGIAPDDHLGHTPSELLGALGEEAEKMMRRVLDDGAPRIDVEIEGATPALPGELRHWRVSWYPIPDDHEDGRPAGVAAVVVEITGEREARRQHQAASALLDAIFAAAPIGIAFWDLDGRYRRVNAALGEVNGLAPEEHLGHTPVELLGELGATLQALLEEVRTTGEPVLDRELDASRPGGRRQFRQTTLFPVRDAHGELAGMAGVVRDVSARHAAESEREQLLRDALVARAAAEAATVRAESARAETDLARRRTDLLVRAGERLAILTRDYERTLQEVAWIAVPEMADVCVFTLVEARGTTRTVAVAASDPDLDRLAARLAEHFVPRADAPRGTGAALRGDVSLVQRIDAEAIDASTDDVEGRRLLTEMGLDSSLTVPMRVRNRVIGALSLVYAGSGRHYDEEDVRLARSLAVRAALAVENARLYTERSHIAQTLQRSLLPSAMPDVPGLELAARYRAAGEQNEVGGDFYDAFRSGEDGTWTVLIGDVAGKGAEAAALTSLTRHTLRAASLRTGDPLESLELLNEALWAQGDIGGRFCTVLYAQVRPDAHGAQVTLATGGHLPPVILRAGGRVERLQLRGALVGGLRDPTFGARSVHLDHGDLLLLFTDGVVELRRRDADGVDIGEQALVDVLAELRGASAEDVVRAVEQRAVDLQDGEPRDDIALVAIRPRP